MALAEVRGEGASRSVVLRCGGGGEAEVLLRGAHVTRWSDERHGEYLYLSSLAKLDGSAGAVRGGIPLVFPQFSGLGPMGLSKHGFARTALWTLDRAEARDDGSAAATLSLRSSDATRAAGYPSEFVTTYTVVLAPAGPATSLSCSWRVENAGGEDMTFALALHTYFAVGDIAGTTVSAGGGASLDAAPYVDQLDGGAVHEQRGDSVAFPGEVDRIYTAAPGVLVVGDAANGRRVHITKSATLPDAVVWNPSVDKARSIGDMPDDDYRRFVCVEAGVIGRDGAGTTVAPGAAWLGEVVMRAAL